MEFDLKRGGGSYRTGGSRQHEFAQFYAHSYGLLRIPFKNLIMFHEIRHTSGTFRALIMFHARSNKTMKDLKISSCFMSMKNFKPLITRYVKMRTNENYEERMRTGRMRTARTGTSAEDYNLHMHGQAVRQTCARTVNKSLLDYTSTIVAQPIKRTRTLLSEYHEP